MQVVWEAVAVADPVDGGPPMSDPIGLSWAYRRPGPLTREEIAARLAASRQDEALDLVRNGAIALWNGAQR